MQLVSPGVDIQIIDESFYASAGAGTVPLIIVATAANKTSPSGTGFAPYTLPAQTGKLFLATSQRELVQNFGNPNFYSVQGTSVHGHELNEYGLHAAYQYLSISNRAYVLRADIDTKQLEASVSAPRGEPLAGQYWLDLDNTNWGVFRSNGNNVPGVAWESKKVTVITADNAITTPGGVDVPPPGTGQNGDVAVVVSVSNNLFFEKITGQWYQIGSSDWKAAQPTTLTSASNPTALNTGDQFVINGTVVTVGSDGTLVGVRQVILDAAIPSVTAEVGSSRLIIKNTAGGNLSIENRTGTPLATLGLTAGTKKGVSVTRTSDAQYPAGSVAGDLWVKGTSPNSGARWTVKLYSASTASYVTLTAPFYPFDSSLSETITAKDQAALTALGVPGAGNVYVAYDVSTGVQQLRRFNGTRSEPLSYVATWDAPTEDPADGTYWYNAQPRVDIMVGNGTTWLGYRRYYPSTDPKGVIIAGSAPITQTDGTPLVDNDLWIDDSDQENYPALHRYSTSTRKWKLIDLSDQTTPFGVVFSDARENSGVAFDGMPNSGMYSYNSEAIEDMLVSDYLDPDAPDPRTFPDGMLMFNTRYSTNNVKVWRPFFLEAGDVVNGAHADPNTNFSHHTYTVGNTSYVFPPTESTGRWVTASGKKLDGSAYFGRKAQRAVIVKAMQAAVVSNQDLRSEIAYYNLMAAPGYPELLDELNSLNIEQKEVAFIVSDTPIRLAPTSTDFINWATNPNGLPNGEGGLSQASLRYTHAVYYPWGLGTNIDGADIMIPPSTIALTTMAYNDQVAYPWFAPAGYQRGMVSAASSVGYLTSEGEFKPVLLNQGQRDTLYLNRINPIAYIPGRGLVVYGQKTLYSQTSALDRVNVARLTCYLRYNLDNLVKPFLFEQNDQQTRDSAGLTVTRFLAGLVTLRALEDFAVLCDETNNTPERRDRNELWIDLAIQPVKSIEFIYIPVRIRNSADSLAIAAG